MLKILDLFLKGRDTGPIPGEQSVFHRKYGYFRRILISNNSALGLIAELENTIYQDRPFTFAHVLNQTEMLIGEVLSIVEDLNALIGARYPELFTVSEEISEAVLKDLRRTKRIEATAFVLPMEGISLENVSEVGGKAANLGEVYNRAHLPVPPGFAVTAYACQQFMEYNDLTRFVDRILKDLDVNDTERLETVSREIESRILEARLPEELERAILLAADELGQRLGREVRFAVRSSATTEDSEASFAGQHATVLNVGRDNLPGAYREVVASTFNPRAIFYRRSKGYLDQDVIMSVACIMMVDPKVSGVMYTIDPNDSRHGVVMIGAVWGLAVSLVDGSSSCDFYQIDKHSGRIELSQVATKESLLRPDSGEGLKKEDVGGGSRKRACLDDLQIRMLVDCGVRLEEHYGYALDIEWAIDRQNKLYILQARPLGRSRKFGADGIGQIEEEAPGQGTPSHPVLLSGGATASEGAAHGVACVIRSEGSLHHIPDGAVLIARKTSPRYVPLMGRIRAIVTDVGSVTGHMASVAREFRIPTLVGTVVATEKIAPGEEITVDATNRVIYAGRVEELLKKKRPINPMKGSPIYNSLQAALKRIAPLNLTDPNEENFRPDACRTIHDIIRFSHEMAMREMFRIGEEVETEEAVAIPLKIRLPMILHVVDLGGGLSLADGVKLAYQEDVTCVPFRAFLKGMTHRDVDWSHHAGAGWRDVGSILAESLLRDPLKEGRMGGPSYAIVAGNYLNFSSRIGYHFTTVDTYCGPLINDNYITFYFKGGAADLGRRSRRALLIAGIIWRLGFKVEHKGDMVRGELKKYESSVLEEKLDLLGRLMGSVRLLDMTLSDDGQVEWYVDQFFEGNYAFKGAGHSNPS
ncbi:MAG: pyruvate, phosphate dikinase [Deltaproteobacteria bacterium]|nr:pyruvate, phosphate dikinase [Deltaproteobacteria bacterium]